MKKQTLSNEEKIDLAQLASVPENRRRELLKLMLAGSVTGLAVALPGCGGGSGAGAGAFPVAGTNGPSTAGSPTGAPPPASQGVTAQKISSFTISVLPDT